LYYSGKFPVIFLKGCNEQIQLVLNSTPGPAEQQNRESIQELLTTAQG